MERYTLGMTLAVLFLLNWKPRALRLRARYRIARLYWRRLTKVEVRHKPLVYRDMLAYYPVWGNAFDHFGDDLLRFGFDRAWSNFKLALRTPRNRKLG